MALTIISLKEDVQGSGGEIKIRFKINNKTDGFLAERLFRSLANSWGCELDIGSPEELAFKYQTGDTINTLFLDLSSGEILHTVSKK